MTTFDLNRSMFLDPRKLPVSAWIGHIPMAGWLVEAAKPGLLVELGTHLGASYFAFCQAVQENGLDTRCYAVDTWQGDEHAGLYGEEVFSVVSEHHRQHYEGFSKLMRMTFDEAAGYFDDASIDLLHIDGLHTYEAVRHDFETWLPKMSAKGVILFHDTNVRERDFGVWKFWAELREKYPGFEFSHTHGLGVLLVGDQPPPALQAFVQQASGDGAADVNKLFEHLGMLVATRDQLAALTQRQIHLDGDNGHLRGVVAERDALVAQLQSTLQARDAALVEVQARLIDEQSALVNAQSALVDRDAMVERARARVVELEAEVRVLSERIAVAEGNGASLQQRIADLEARMAEAAATIDRQQVEGGRLAEALQASSAEVSALRTSISWRITAPVRALVSMFSRG